MRLSFHSFVDFPRLHKVFKVPQPIRHTSGRRRGDAERAVNLDEVAGEVTRYYGRGTGVRGPCSITIRSTNQRLSFRGESSPWSKRTRRRVAESTEGFEMMSEEKRRAAALKGVATKRANANKATQRTPQQ
jgi:hypothetical protein